MSQENKLSYNTDLYPFRQIIGKIFDWTEPLEDLHKKFRDSDKIGVLSFIHDQGTDYHKIYYSSPYLPELLELYEKFIRNEIAPRYRENFIIYQAKPTFRISLPNGTAVGEWHTDGQYHHPETEINFWLPFTEAFETNSVWAESQPAKGDYHPFNLHYGEYMTFYANKCRHGNKPNQTGQSRVSFDFRIIPGSLWKEPENLHTTIKTGMSFTLGSYYKKMILENS